MSAVSASAESCAPASGTRPPPGLQYFHSTAAKAQNTCDTQISI
jgi:hypothetical protein